MEKEQLIRKIKKDLRFDIVGVWVATIFSAFGLVTWIAGMISMELALVYCSWLFIWLNGYLITKRNLQMVEMTK